MATWTWRKIAVAPGRKFQLFSSGQIDSPLLGTAGHPLSGFGHWMDSALAMRWFRYAKTLADQFDKSLNRDAVGPLAAVQRYYDQLLYVHKIVEAIANGFNACNVPWYMHRPSRELYWTYLSGRPDFSVMFDQRQNSCPGWYTSGVAGAQDGLPVVKDASSGIIPRAGRNFYKSRVGNVRRNSFVPTVGLGISMWNLRPDSPGLDVRLDEGAATNQWYLEDDVVNHGFVRSYGVMNFGTEVQVLDYGPRLMTLCSGARQDESIAAAATGSSRVAVDAWSPMAYPLNKCEGLLPTEAWFVTSEHEALSDRNKLDYDDWRSFRGDFGAHIGDVPMRMSLGPYHYLRWLKDWTSTLIMQTPEEIVTSVREMAIYTNQKWFENPGSTNAVRDLLNSTSDQMRAASARDPGIMYAEAAIGAAGAALAGATYGISAIVAAAATLTIEIVEAFKPKNGDNSQAGRDDLGRMKPLLERSWLSGNPSNQTADGRPKITVPEVPGSIFLSGVLLPGITPGTPVVSTRAPSASAPTRDPVTASHEEPSSGSSGLLLPALSVGAAVFIGYQLLKRRK